jgi:hypothetical protein
MANPEDEKFVFIANRSTHGVFVGDDAHDAMMTEQRLNFRNTLDA